MVEDFYINGNPELKKTVGRQFYKALSISSNPFNVDIQQQIDGLSKINFDYSKESENLSKKWIVFYHSDQISDAKHKYIIKPTNLYCGSNGDLGALRLKFIVIQSEFIGIINAGADYISQTKKEITIDSVDEGDVDCRKLFHYVTYYFSPRYFQGTKVFNESIDAEEYFKRLS